MISNKVIGVNIRNARDAANHMTQEVAAERLDLSYGHYCHIERGTRPASVELLGKMCHLFAVQLSDLLAGAMTDAHKITAKGRPASNAERFAHLVGGCTQEQIETVFETIEPMVTYFKTH